MQKLFFLIFLYAFTFAEDTSFITKFEYGEMLYKNPRGISCIKCHGEKGESKFLVNYKELQKKTNTIIAKSITAPNIKNLQLETFIAVLQNKENKSLVMPTYFLSDEEIKAIYHYLKVVNQKPATTPATIPTTSTTTTTEDTTKMAPK